MRKFWESIYSPNYISGYNPFLLKDMNRAIERMVSAINTRKNCFIWDTKCRWTMCYFIPNTGFEIFKCRY